MTTNATQPAWISVTYAEPCDYHVALHVSANNDESLSITVLHESLVGAAQYVIAGNEDIDLVVQDKETLHFIVRDKHSAIIAYEQFEVNVDLAEQLSAVLSPMSGLIVDQCPRHLVDNAVTRAINEASKAVTGELVAVGAEVTR